MACINLFNNELVIFSDTLCIKSEGQKCCKMCFRKCITILSYFID